MSNALFDECCRAACAASGFDPEERVMFQLGSDRYLERWRKTSAVCGKEIRAIIELVQRQDNGESNLLSLFDECCRVACTANGFDPDEIVNVTYGTNTTIRRERWRHVSTDSGKEIRAIINRVQSWDRGE